MKKHMCTIYVDLWNWYEDLREDYARYDVPSTSVDEAIAFLKSRGKYCQAIVCPYWESIVDYLCRTDISERKQFIFR